MISIGIQEEKNAVNDLQEDCSKRKNYCKHNQGWQLQQPIYVDEPTWVDVDIDYMDSPQRMDDPYILTRGKKIYRIKNPEQMVKTIEDYEAALGYPSKNQKLLLKSRVRRTAKTSEESQNKTADIKNDQIKERDYSLQGINNTAIVEVENKGEKSFNISEEAEKPKDTSYVFNKKYEKNDLKNLPKELLDGFKFTKQNQIFANDLITDFIERKQKIPGLDISRDIENERIAKIDRTEGINDNKNHFVTNVNDKNNKSALLKNQDLSEIRKKRELYEIDTNFEKDVEKNETYEQMKTYVRKLNDRYAPDNPFILSQDKNSFYDKTERSNKKATDRNKFIGGAWKLHNALRRKSEEINGAARNRFDITNKDGIETTNLQLANESNLKNSEIKSSNYREKRTACKACKKKSQLQDEWLRNIERKIQESLSLERRDKHSDILERLAEPYIISRGKKVPRDFERDVLGGMSSSRNANDDDRPKMTRPPMESLLRTLLIETSRCNDDNCGISANWLSDERLTPRDRRGTLDEIFEAYDPYYVARGKRTIRPEVPFETENARQT